MFKASKTNPVIRSNIGPSVILVRPQLGHNIGAVARAMFNFGLTDLRIVRPRDGWPSEDAVAAASGAGNVLDNTKLFSTTQSACADLNFVFATTARSRGLVKDICSPEDAIQSSFSMTTQGQKVGILYGPERSGLENSDICLAQKIIAIPVNPEFSSLNLAQSVAVVAYEWFKLRYSQSFDNALQSSIELAKRVEVEHLRKSLEDKLKSVNYFWPRDKSQSLKKNLNNLIGKMLLSSADVRTLHGVLKALTKDKTQI